MARSFSLADYLNAPRKTRADEPAYAVRPDGPLIWAHATDRAHAGALRQLADRLRAHVPDLSLLLTNRDDLQPDATDRGPHEIAVPVPDNTADAAEIFLEHWSPDFAIWTTGALRPALIDCASRKDIPLALVDADEAMLTRPGWRWLPDFQSKVFDKFDFILTRDMQTHRYLERLSLKTVDVQMGGRLFDGAIHLPHNESDREELATLLLGRPVWLAAHVTAGETPVALEAHRDITRFAHRALVIVSPANEPEAERCLTAIRASGFHHLRWSDGDLPDEATQVILADVPGELGLWYRIAPIAFMGSSLEPRGPGSDPNEPAAHGSAILHGPGTGRFSQTYARYTEAGAARRVNSARGLADAVKRLIPPHQSAVMAHAAWEVASRGASLTDRIVERVLDKLETRARP